MRKLKRKLITKNIIITILLLILTYVLTLDYEYTINNRVVVSQPIWAYVIGLD